MLRLPSKSDPKKLSRKWTKIEVFRGTEWKGFSDVLGMPLAPARHKLFRIRINGRWNDTQSKKNIKWFTKWTFRDLLFRSIDL